MTRDKVLVYLLRHDLRASDNPILNHLASTSHDFTHLLPVYVFPAYQIEISGFLAPDQTSPYPPALSKVGKFWRCGPHRAKFLAQCAWDLKGTLEGLRSGLLLCAGSFEDVVRHLFKLYHGSSQSVSAVWMTEEPSSEEVADQEAISSLCAAEGIDFKLWADEKYFIDDRDTGLEKPTDLPDVFTTYRKTQEPLRQRPRPSLPRPRLSYLPPLPRPTWSPKDLKYPFVSPSTYEDLEARLLKPLDNIVDDPPEFPLHGETAHPFLGGESKAWDRVSHLVKAGCMTDYQATRNGLIGPDFSTKLSAYLAFGCVTARQVHEELLKLEDGTEPLYTLAKGFAMGENEGTRSVRFELLWRDYMRLCCIKFGNRLFHLSGFGKISCDKEWKSADETQAREDQNPSAQDVKKIINRLLTGRTGMGLIDASQRELYHTGYTSNRARQNVANFLAKHLGIDWRYGAEWYESMLIDYDVSSNWSNWQYMAGVGLDPRGEARMFNPVKQAFDYDNNGMYVRMWVPELKQLEKLENVFQPWTTSEADLAKFGLEDNIMVTDPIKKIDFDADRKPRNPRRRAYRIRGQNGQNRRGSRTGTNNWRPNQSNGNGNGNGSGPGNGEHQNSSDENPQNNGDGPQGYRPGSYSQSNGDARQHERRHTPTNSGRRVVNTRDPPRVSSSQPSLPSWQPRRNGGQWRGANGRGGLAPGRGGHRVPHHNFNTNPYPPPPQYVHTPPGFSAPPGLPVSVPLPGSSPGEFPLPPGGFPPPPPPYPHMGHPPSI